MKRILTACLVLALATTACGGASTEALTIYSGRSEDLVGPLLDRFTEETGIETTVRYAGSTDLAATIREEGPNSPADVFFAQDPASLGAVAEADLLSALPTGLLGRVEPRFSDEDGLWVGVSGRTRVVVYDTTRLDPADLPDGVDGFASPEWSSRLGIAPTNGSFLAFVAAMIVMRGESETADWLESIAENSPAKYEGNSAIVAAVNGGEIAVGLVNHYYLLRLQDELGATNAANHFLSSGGPGALVMPAGAGILATTDQRDEAERFVEFLLSEGAQAYFAEETFEYPLVAGVDPVAGLPPLTSLNAPALDLSALAPALDLATDLVARAGLL